MLYEFYKFDTPRLSLVPLFNLSIIVHDAARGMCRLEIRSESQMLESSGFFPLLDAFTKPTDFDRYLSITSAAFYGTFHQVSTKHLGRYCNEFSYRFNRRDEQLQMFDGKLKSILDEKAGPCKKLTVSVQEW